LHIITRDVLKEVEGVLAVEAAGKADAAARAAAAALGKADADARILQLQQEVAAAGEVVFSFFISLLLVFVFIVLQSPMWVICWEAGGVRGGGMAKCCIFRYLHAPTCLHES
jgi:hypothetical protein